MIFGPNQPRSQPIVRVARLGGPELVLLPSSRHTPSAFDSLSHLTPPLSCRSVDTLPCEISTPPSALWGDV